MARLPIQLAALALLLPALGIASASATAPASPKYSASSPANVARWSGEGPRWSGDHRFLDVFCLQTPEPADVATLTEVMLNNNTLYYSRIDYPDRNLSLYVVTSTMPPDLSREAEHAAQWALAQQYVAQIPSHADAGVVESPLGRSVRLRLRNVEEGDDRILFPFDRRFGGELDSPLHALAVHRLFSHNGSRIELAARQVFTPALKTEEEGPAIASLEAFASRAAEALGDCSVGMSKDQASGGSVHALASPQEATP